MFDSASQGEQITVTTGGNIELEAKWKPFRVQCHRKADPGHSSGARRVSVPGQEDARYIIAVDLELPLVLDSWRYTRSGWEDQCIRLSESNRRKTSAQLLSIRAYRSLILLIGNVVWARRHDEARPAIFDVLTQAGIDMLEGHWHLIGSEEILNCAQRLVEEDGPSSSSGQDQEISAQIDLHKLGSGVLELT
ncbi:MAG TPA: hypothetical protein VFG14_19475 [Chthoniobacteraceae bacterium]|nr:hypothetical protein [Chthoniobacteraceae bacterium]